MCGIVGYVGEEQCIPILMHGLRKLEYRGYDSAGVAVYNNGICIQKAKGKLINLTQQLENNPISGTTGIGHTRWATHGEPNYTNSHPQIDTKGNIAIVHNGIIENYYTLKKSLLQKGIAFVSETDTEVVVQLLGLYYDGDMRTTLLRVLPMLEGSFALAILDANQPDKLYCTRKESPLIVGKGARGNFIASDIPAILKYSRDIYLLDDMEIAVLSREEVHFYDGLGNRIDKQSMNIQWDIDSAEKGGYEHFMLKEINEQPKVLKDTLAHYVDTANHTIRREMMPFTNEQANALKKITIVACGTAYHAGLIGKALIEKLARVNVETDIASEYRYRDPIVGEGETVIVVSQSGETADTIAAMRAAKAKGCRVVALCNAIGSTITREADVVMFTLAGPEIAVASTKAYTTQQLLFVLLALDIGNLRGNITDVQMRDYLKELVTIPQKAQLVVEKLPRVQQFASRVMDSKSVFFIGRGLDYALAMEAALKLKEISYIHSEAYASGELKHGTIALIEQGTLVVAIATQGNILDKTLSNIEEVRARGAKVLVLTTERKHIMPKAEVWTIPDTSDIFSSILSIIPMQLFAYFMALLKGCDIDKPRNLAKSVTVE